MILRVLLFNLKSFDLTDFHTSTNPGLPFGLFWSSFLEIKWFGHLAFFNLEENSIFLGLIWLNFNKSYSILWYFKIYLIYFSKFSLKIWPLLGLFYHLKIWPFLKLLIAKFGLLNFLGPGNPELTHVCPQNLRLQPAPLPSSLPLFFV